MSELKKSPDGSNVIKPLKEGAFEKGGARGPVERFPERPPAPAGVNGATSPTGKTDGANGSGS